MDFLLLKLIKCLKVRKKMKFLSSYSQALIAIVCCGILSISITPINDLLAQAQSIPSSTSTPFSTYSNPSYNFEINYPTNWDKIEQKPIQT